MKVNELEKKLKEIEQIKAPEKLSTEIIQYSKEKLVAERNELNWDIPPLIYSIFYTILGSIPFIELFWLINEKLIKKNEIKIKMNF